MLLRRSILFILLIIFQVNIFAFSNYAAKGIADENGRILSGENENLVHPLASLTKIMTLLIVTEKIEKKEISLYDTVTISKEADRLRGSSAHLSEGYKLTVEELFKAALIHSGNDAAYALAQYVAGDAESFVKLMNEKAYELGLKNTVYHSPTGLPRFDGNLDISTISDIAKLTSVAIKHPIFLRYSSLKETYITTWKAPLRTTNKLLGKYEGVDGLKTGYHGTAGYNIIVTAERDNKRFIAIVLGAPSDTIRTLETKKLLDYGFNNYEYFSIGSKGDLVATVTLSNSPNRKVDLVLNEDVSVLINKNDSSQLIKTAYISKNLAAPLSSTETAGLLSLFAGKTSIGEYKIVPSKDIRQLTILEKLIRFLTFNKI